MKQTATHIAQQCLRFWDGPFGFRAGWDSGGAQAGVWKSKFDGVRCAALLLAFRNVNTRLQNRSDAPGKGCEQLQQPTEVTYHQCMMYFLTVATVQLHVAVALASWLAVMTLGFQGSLDSRCQAMIDTEQLYLHTSKHPYRCICKMCTLQAHCCKPGRAVLPLQQERR